MEPVQIPINGELDLHTFQPKQIPDLLDDYLRACFEKDILQVRVIHGKGKGVQKARIRALLSRHPLVARFSDAPMDSGGWGATLVELKARQSDV
ncbi:MAG: Smr/MutS family protein [Desulfobacteraceae bacterium]|nr:Smr/MutS family protein [Desulfobacteraceae bacterium]